MKSEEEFKSYWNKVAGRKTFTLDLRSKLLMAHASVDGAVLDYGCGDGRMLGELERLGFSSIYACDISENMVKLAAERHSDAVVKVNAAGTVPFADAAFDVVIVLAVLTCIPDNAGQQALIREIMRVLKPGGVIHVGDFLLNHDKRNLERYAASADKYACYGVFELPEGAVLRHHDPAYMRELLKVFSPLEYEEVVHRTMNGHTSNGFYFTGRKLV
ncbi:MAG: class I SAM-dependent methyltransferase [Victivallales bacterium]|nr:class I SAM-dependent methyltransferase [Victivallales bacterium]